MIAHAVAVPVTLDGWESNSGIALYTPLVAPSSNRLIDSEPALESCTGTSTSTWSPAGSPDCRLNENSYQSGTDNWSRVNSWMARSPLPWKLMLLTGSARTWPIFVAFTATSLGVPFSSAPQPPVHRLSVGLLANARADRIVCSAST